MTAKLMSAAFGLLLGASAAPLYAQGPPDPPAEEPRLVFERETFSYAGAGRRDPFRPLSRRDEIGPLFDELKLSMIIYHEQPSLSVVVVSDGGNRRYRLRRGETVGNATVVEISPTRVRFSVDSFGVRQQEVLELKRTKPEGA
jgi:hypothetical protein